MSVYLPTGRKSPVLASPFGIDKADPGWKVFTRRFDFGAKGRGGRDRWIYPLCRSVFLPKDPVMQNAQFMSTEFASAMQFKGREMPNEP